ncbi:hypothetical protein SCALM49S_00080 [Streptomyces californicus]
MSQGEDPRGGLGVRRVRPPHAALQPPRARSASRCSARTGSGRHGGGSARGALRVRLLGTGDHRVGRPPAVRRHQAPAPCVSTLLTDVSGERYTGTGGAPVRSAPPAPSAALRRGPPGGRRPAGRPSRRGRARPRPIGFPKPCVRMCSIFCPLHDSVLMRAARLSLCRCRRTVGAVPWRPFPCSGTPCSVPAPPVPGACRAVARPVVRACPGIPLAPSAARRFVRAALAEWTGLGVPAAVGFSDRLADDAVTVTNELVTNAVVHAGTTVDLVITLEEGGKGPMPAALVLEVTDHHPARPVSGDDPGPEPEPAGAAAGELPDPAEYGRGLQLVATLADSWGITYRTGRKTVWARLPVDDWSAPPAQPEADALRRGLRAAELLAPVARRTERDDTVWDGRGAPAFLAEASDLLAGQLDEDLVAAIAGPAPGAPAGRLVRDPAGGREREVGRRAPPRPGPAPRRERRRGPARRPGDGSFYAPGRGGVRTRTGPRAVVGRPAEGAGGAPRPAAPTGPRSRSGSPPGAGRSAPSSSGGRATPRCPRPSPRSSRTSSAGSALPWGPPAPTPGRPPSAASSSADCSPARSPTSPASPAPSCTSRATTAWSAATSTTSSRAPATAGASSSATSRAPAPRPPSSPASPAPGCGSSPARASASGRCWTRSTGCSSTTRWRPPRPPP